MEGNYLARILAIFAIIVGSAWVLTPTFLADTRAELSEKASSVSAPTTPQGVDLDVRITGAKAGDQAVIEDRLKFMGVPVARVEDEGTAFTVYLDLGGRTEDIDRATKGKGALRLFSPIALGLDTDALQEALAAGQDAEVRQAVRDAILNGDLSTATPLDIVPERSWSGRGAYLNLPEGAPSVVLVELDGKVVGSAGLSTDENGLLFVSITETPADAKVQARVIGTGTLSGDLTSDYTDEVAVVEEEAVEETPETQAVWWNEFLPQTKLNLGLDLQGGIDFTLYVDTKAAVQSRVARDRAMLLDKAEQEGVAFQARRDRTQPAMFVRLEGGGDVFEFGGSFVADYLNEGIVTDDDGTEWALLRLNEEVEKEIANSAVDQVLETLRKRVDSTGVKEPSIVKKGAGQINIQLPGVVDVQEAVDAIGTRAVLEFRMVDEEFPDSELERLLRDAQAGLPADQFKNDLFVNEWLWSTGRLSENNIIMWLYDEIAPGELARGAAIALKNKVLLTGGDVNNAGVRMDQYQQAYVALSFKPVGSKIFCDVTTENVNKRFAIILDDQIRSAPVIKSAICGGTASIEMGMSADARKDAENLSLVLRSGSLTAPVNIGEMRTVGATLGADAIQAGVWGAAVGGFLTLSFMGLWYRRSGVIADFALVVNVLLVFAILATFGATLTLPGFAGIALTIGMAVDANIIIYERIREELRLGVKARKAVEVGYSKGVVAIIDANITTAIAGIVLYSYGTGPIKGFAVTLLIGIFTTLVTALFVTRTLMELSTRNSNAELKI